VEARNTTRAAARIAIAPPPTSPRASSVAATATLNYYCPADTATRSNFNTTALVLRGHERGAFLDDALFRLLEAVVNNTLIGGIYLFTYTDRTPRYSWRSKIADGVLGQQKLGRLTHVDALRYLSRGTVGSRLLRLEVQEPSDSSNDSGRVGRAPVIGISNMWHQMAAAAEAVDRRFTHVVSMRIDLLTPAVQHQGMQTRCANASSLPRLPNCPKCTDLLVTRVHAVAHTDSASCVSLLVGCSNTVGTENIISGGRDRVAAYMRHNAQLWGAPNASASLNKRYSHLLLEGHHEYIAAEEARLHGYCCPRWEPQSWRHHHFGSVCATKGLCAYVGRRVGRDELGIALLVIVAAFVGGVSWLTGACEACTFTPFHSRWHAAERF